MVMHRAARSRSGVRRPSEEREAGEERTPSPPPPHHSGPGRRQALLPTASTGETHCPARLYAGLGWQRGRFTEIQIIFYRNGKMLGGRGVSFERTEMPQDELLASFVLQYYSQAPTIPAEVLLPVPWMNPLAAMPCSSLAFRLGI